MKLKSFRIKNFRSIIDSGECFLAPDITILAGKNESGKTNILEGLQKFNKEEEFEENDKPLDPSNTKPIEISFKFTIENNEVQKILRDYNIKIEPKGNYSLEITKSSESPNDYEVTGEVFNAIEQSEKKSRREASKIANALIKKAYTILKRYSKKESDFENIKLLVEDTADEVDNKIQQLFNIIDEIKQSINKQSDVKKLDSYKEKISDEVSKINSSTSIDNIKRELINILPRVILFSSFNSILPSEVTIASLQNPATLKKDYKIVEDFAKLSGLDIQALASTNDNQRRINIANSAAKRFSKSFSKYWNQDPVEITVNCNQQQLLFYVQDVISNENGREKEVDKTVYKVEQRSKGLQWYLSFFIMLEAEGTEKGNIILIDEPGLYLHAAAQQDVLRLLERLAEDNQIIFTTHSPYLIDPDKLGRIRLIIKNEGTKETKIQNNFNKGADENTLTPIITAIGLDLSKGLSFNRDKNIVVEGISDYYYMEGVLNYLRKKKDYDFPEDISIIPCVGHTTVSLIISLLIGWRLKNYVIVLDKKGTTQTYNKLKRDGVPDKRIIFVGKTDSDSIESLFSEEDSKKYDINSTGKNKKSKTITSKNFFEKITQDKTAELSEETIKNFQEQLFDKIKEIYSKDNKTNKA